MSQEITAAVRQDDGVALGGAAVFIPLLQRCGTEASVQAARFPDPSRPPLRADLSVPSLRFYFSPGRVRRIMRILRSALPGARRSFSLQASVRAGVAATRWKPLSLHARAPAGGPNPRCLLGCVTVDWPSRQAADFERACLRGWRDVIAEAP